jgi:cyclase
MLLPWLLGGLAGLTGLVAYALRRSAPLPPLLRSSGDLQLHPLAEDVWLYRGFFSNSAVFVLPEGVVVVDTQVSPLAGERLRLAIARVTEKPVVLIIYTHYHGDHSGGTEAFPGVAVLATEDTARLVVERDSERVEYACTFGLHFQHVHPTVAPTRKFRDRLEIDIAGDTLVVQQAGRVETPDACLVWWPRKRAVAVGDGVATRDYPYLGVPFLDEGLRDDGQWLGFLRTVRDLAPLHLLPGHGPPLQGPEIARRLDLLERLFTDLLTAVREELAQGTPLPELMVRVDARLLPYRQRPDLRERTVSQRFAIWRAYNNLSPERQGRGWWQDLRPSVVQRAGAARTEAELATITEETQVLTRARRLLAARDRPLAVTLLETWTRRHPDDAQALGLLADTLFDAARDVRPTVDATEYIAAATQVARAAVQVDPQATLGLLTLGCAEVFGSLVLAQPMAPGMDKLRRALDRPGLTPQQKRKGLFFLGKAHQYEHRDADADAVWRTLLPRPLRWLYPLLRERLRAEP